MYIISKFKDYYDTSMGMYGIDKSIIYKRFESNIDVKLTHDDTRFPSRTYVSAFNPNFPRVEYVPYIIGFCGKTYVAYKFYKSISFDSDVKEWFLYGMDAVDAILKLNKSRIEIIKGRHKKTNNKLKQELLSMISNYHGKENYVNVFLEHSIPIFVYDCNHNNGYDINASLKDVEFYKMFEPYLAFQEIEMYVGGVLTNPENDMVVVDEKYRQLQHGMDKWSFRNPDPPKRKQKLQK